MLKSNELFEKICETALDRGHIAWKIEGLCNILEKLNEWDQNRPSTESAQSALKALLDLIQTIDSKPKEDLNLTDAYYQAKILLRQNKLLQ